MRTLLKTAGLLLALVVAQSASAAFVTRDVTGGGDFINYTTSNTAWVQDNPFDSEEVNFWTLTGLAGQTLSVFVSPINYGGQLLDAGISLYFGEVTEFELLYSGFDHAGDFANNTLIATTNMFFGTAGNNASLLDIVLPQNGVYTIAVGGEAGFSLADTYHYNMSVSQVPLPAGVWLLASGLIALFGYSRKARQSV